MNKLKQIAQWPAKPENNIAPLYQIVWRTIWFPFILVGMIVTCFGVAMSYGKEKTVDFWKAAM